MQPAIAKKTKSAAAPLDVGRPGSTSRQDKLMRSANDAFSRGLESGLSGCLQTETKVELKQTGLTTASLFRKDLPNPTCLIALRLHPRTDRMILHLDCATALIMLEMLLGGKEHQKPAPRELTEIEWSLLEEVIRVMVRPMGEAWRAFHAVEFEVESLGSDPTFLNLPETGQPLARLSFGIQWGEPSSEIFGSFELVLPQEFFDLPVESTQSQELVRIPAPADVDRNFALLEDAKVKLEVTLQGPTLQFEELMGLKTGQVVTFDYPISNPLRATVNGAAPMTGHIVSARQKRAFQIERLPVRAIS
jgi:flagellar motor switch protein FliM